MIRHDPRNEESRVAGVASGNIALLGGNAKTGSKAPAKASIPHPELTRQAQRQRAFNPLADPEAQRHVFVWRERHRATADGAEPVWSLLSAGQVERFPVLAGIEALWISVDHDDAGTKAATVAARTWHRAGREAHLIKPNAAGADLNNIAVSNPKCNRAA